ncbi:MAG: hypothetical protein ACLVES_05495 [Faecalibacterium prausnitzii]
MWAASSCATCWRQKDFCSRTMWTAAASSTMPPSRPVKSGGSGPGCCASVLCGHILPRLEKGTQKRVLFIATGALMSQTTFLQKESIPAIAHLVELRSPQQKEENG